MMSKTWSLIKYLINVYKYVIVCLTLFCYTIRNMTIFFNFLKHGLNFKNEFFFGYFLRFPFFKIPLCNLCILCMCYLVIEYKFYTINNCRIDMLYFLEGRISKQSHFWCHLIIYTPCSVLPFLPSYVCSVNFRV